MQIPKLMCTYFDRKAKRRRARTRIKSQLCLITVFTSVFLFFSTYLLIESHCQQVGPPNESYHTDPLELAETTTTSNLEDDHNDSEQDDENTANDQQEPQLLAPKSIRPASRTSSQQQRRPNNADSSSSSSSSSGNTDKRVFAMELLKLLHEQYASPATTTTTTTTTRASSKQQVFEERQSFPGLPMGPVMSQLLEAISGDGDIKRLTDWAKNWFSPTALGEILTQFVVSKLGSVNCAAIVRPDKEEQLIPRFLLFNEHYVDVPFELSINPTANECLVNGRFDPFRRTIVLIHGYLTGYTLVDGITNIKNRLLDMNKLTSERALEAFIRASQNNGTYVLTDELHLKVRQQLYNVIIVDWFTGANPTPRSNYIKAAVNAQLVGRLIARFLSALIVQCKSPASKLQIIAHSLGCHVSGFTGKELNAAGHRLAKITHLDPVGLCFGRLFSKPSLRLSPNDAQETQAVHTSLNIFDNPLDGAHSNFLVNGGRDQTGCGGQNEVRNSTSSSVSLLFDPAAKFGPCSHLRALALYEDDMASRPGQCQMVGYRCQSYERFLAGKCGQCDATNSQCRLMSLPPIELQFRKLTFSPSTLVSGSSDALNSHYRQNITTVTYTDSGSVDSTKQPYYSIITPNSTTNSTPAAPSSGLYGAPSNYAALTSNRSERRLDGAAGKPTRIVQAIGRLRADTRAALAEGWTTFRGLREPSLVIKDDDDDDDDDAVSAILGHDEPDNQNDHQVSSSNQTAFQSNLNSTTSTTTSTLDTSGKPTAEWRSQHELVDQIPLGSQPMPRGNLMGPLFFLGTGSMAPYCVNYYQFRVLIAESRLQRVLQNNGLASNRLAPPIGHETLGESVMGARQKAAQWAGRDMLHLTVKLTDHTGHFFKGFSMLENARQMGRVFNELASWPLPQTFGVAEPREPMLELTMLLNTTRSQPVRVTQTIISYYFHSMVLADRVEVNYMSNISPE